MLNFLKPKYEICSAKTTLNRDEVEKEIKLVGASSTPLITTEILNVEKTYKLYIGGKQTRPDTSSSRPVYFKEKNSIDNKPYCLVADASRKGYANF